jgi:hypothetical protein
VGKEELYDSRETFKIKGEFAKLNLMLLGDRDQEVLLSGDVNELSTDLGNFSQREESEESAKSANTNGGGGEELAFAASGLGG